MLLSCSVCTDLSGGFHTAEKIHGVPLCPGTSLNYFLNFIFFNVSLKLFYLPLNHCEKINKWELEALFMNSLDPALVQRCCWISLNLIHVPPTEIHMRAMSFIIAPSRERVQSNFPVDITL